MAETTDTRQFAIEQVDRLLGQLAFQVSRTLRSHDPNSVDALRVAIRRFSQAFVVFALCFPAKDVKKIRRRLREMMSPAREVRDCDVAIDRLSRSKPAEGAPLHARLGRQRRDAERILLSTLRRWMERKSSLKWRTRLQVAFASKKGFPETAQELAAGLLPGMAEEFFRRGKRAAAAGSSTDELQQFHVAAKKFRYTLELFVTLYGPDLSAWLDRIARVHEMAGRAREMDGGQRKQMEEFVREWTEEFGGRDRAKHWIHYLAGTLEPARKPMARSAAAANHSRSSVG